MLGMVPLKPLFSKNKPVKWVKLFMENGSGPEKLLLDRSSRDRRVNSVKLGGKPSKNWLFWR